MNKDVKNIKDAVEKATVPKEFDEWFKNIVEIHNNMDSAKEEAIYLITRVGYYGYPLNKSLDSENETSRELFKLVLENKLLFIRAILDGYEVEREPLYYIYDSVSNSYLSRESIRSETYDWYKSEYGDGLFTEKEIIEKFGRKYLPFKVPVEKVME